MLPVVDINESVIIDGHIVVLSRHEQLQPFSLFIRGYELPKIIDHIGSDLAGTHITYEHTLTVQFDQSLVDPLRHYIQSVCPVHHQCRGVILKVGRDDL